MSAFHSEIRKDIQAAKTPDDWQKLARKIFKVIDQLFSQGCKSINPNLACRAGCSLCCHVKVDVAPLEVFAIVDFIKNTFSSERIEEVKQRASENKKRVAGMSSLQQVTTLMPCPLLKDAMCSVYSVRPVACRQYLSTDFSRCEYSFNHPKELNAPMAPVPEISGVLAAYYMAAVEALKKEGYDALPYDLSGALDAVFNESKCEKRWRSKKSAFSKEIIAKDFKELGNPENPLAGLL